MKTRIITKKVLNHTKNSAGGYIWKTKSIY